MESINLLFPSPGSPCNSVTLPNGIYGYHSHFTSLGSISLALTTSRGMDILSPTDINEHHVEKIVQGVETDADGMVIAYWVCDRHPLASTSVTGLTASHWTRVEAYPVKTGRPAGWVHIDTRAVKSRWVG